jgi:hypothetical protein
MLGVVSYVYVAKGTLVEDNELIAQAIILFKYIRTLQKFFALFCLHTNGMR